MKNNATCKHCKKGYVMGWNGTVDGCDKCTGTVRDFEGNAWYADEQEQTRLVLSTGEIYTITRQDALNPKRK